MVFQISRIIVLVFITVFSKLSSQNIILNGDFENNVKNYILPTGHRNDTVYTLDSFVFNWNSLFGYPRYENLKLNHYNLKLAFNSIDSLSLAFKNNSYSFLITQFTTKDTFNYIPDYFHDDTGKYANFYYFNCFTSASTSGFFQLLNSPLIKDSNYVLSYRFKNGSKKLNIYNQHFWSNLMNNFGVLFTTKNVSKDYSKFKTDPNYYRQYKIDYYKDYLQDTILDTNYKWNLKRIDFKADSNYRFLNFGIFRDLRTISKKITHEPTYHYVSIGSSTTYFFEFAFMIDDVRLLPKWQYLDVTTDVYACEGDSIELKVISGAGGYQWAKTNHPTNILSTQNTIKIKLADTNITYQVMSPYDTALIPIYVSKSITIFDTIPYKSCENKPLKISTPNIYQWYDNTKDTTKTFTQTGSYWYETKEQCNFRRTQLNIQINSTQYDTLRQSSCDSFTYKNTNYKNSGTYTFQYISSQNCDSFHTLNLTISPSKTTILHQFSCTPYFWVDSIYSKTGTYIKKLKTVNQCDSILTLNLSIGLNDKIKLENGINYTALQDSVSYQWYRCNPWRKITNETKPTFTTTTKGSYAVILDNGKGCRDTSDCIALYSSGFATTIEPITRIYPNPFNSNLTIELDKSYKEISIKIYDLTGRQILNTQYKNLATCDLKLETLSKGSYYLQIETETNTQFFNILKE